MGAERTFLKQISFWCWLFIAILEIIGFAIAVPNHGLSILGFYTQESNLVLMIAALCYIMFCIKNKSCDVPRWVRVLQYIATCLVAVTFVVVIFVFVPMLVPYGIEAVLGVVFGEANLYHHFLCPILAVLSFIILEKNLIPKMKVVLFATAPTLLYAVVSTILNVLKLVEGPYPFLMVYKQPVLVSVVWFFVIPLGGFVIAFLLKIIKQKVSK